MAGEVAAARSHPAVVAAMVVAAIAVAACALVAIAYMLGWIPARSVAPKPASAAPPAQQVSALHHDVVLAPGETLVSAPDTPIAAVPVPAPRERALPAEPKPTTPSYTRSAPAPKPAAPARAPEPAPAAPPRAPEPAYVPPPPEKTYASPMPSRAAPARPEYARTAPPPMTSYERSSRSICINCGVVAGMTSFNGDWEVFVRFEDGSSERLKYADRPRLNVGDRVRLEDGRLVRD